MKEEFLEMREIEELVKKGKISLTNVIKTQKLTMEFCRDYVLDKDDRYIKFLRDSDQNLEVVI